MNIEEYISSGVLEAYALGELSPQEMAEVNEHLLKYPALREELKRIEETQEELLMKAAIQPPVSGKAKLFKTIESTGTVRALPLPDNGKTIRWKYAVAASVVLAMVASYFAFDYRGRWLASEENLSELIAQNQQIARDYNNVHNRLEKIESDLQISNDPSFERIVLKGTAAAPDAMASVFWNAETQEVYLSIRNLKSLARENQYQLWAIVDGKPVDAGVFDVSGTNGLLAMKTIRGASAFAVTIEPRGGRTSPTLETMQVIGEVVG
ncbi:MAG: anti-sigma factor [Cyclobacteriaceae bacterium]|nr:anti-sigma factor [Cyclobacteriaceae bacterium]